MSCWPTWRSRGRSRWSSNGVLGHGRLHGLQGAVVRGAGVSGVGLLVLAAVGSLVFTLLSGALDYLGDRLMNSAGERITASIRADVFSRLLRLPMAFHDRRSVGELTSRMSSDTNRIEDSLIGLFSTLLPGVMNLGGLAAVITALDWRLGVIALSAAPLVFFAAKRYSRADPSGGPSATHRRGAAGGADRRDDHGHPDGPRSGHPGRARGGVRPLQRDGTASRLAFS